MSSDVRARVLLVDDDVAFRESTAQMLRTLGDSCVVAPDAEAGWELFGSEPFDVVVSDICMQGNGELKFVRRLAASEKNPPVILVTGFPSIDTAIEALDLRLVAYLVKPFDISDLSKGIERALNLQVRRTSFDRMQNHLKELHADLTEISSSTANNELLEATAEGSHDLVETGMPHEEISSALLEAGLTPREQEIVHRLVDGYRLSTIADKFCISPHTVRRHLKSVFMKLEVNSQTELVEKLKPWY